VFEVTNRLSSWSIEQGVRNWTARPVAGDTAGLPEVSDTSGE
jgi:hypothetical protein